MQFLQNKRLINFSILFSLMIVFIGITVSFLSYQTQSRTNAQTVATTDFLVTVCPHGLGNCGDNVTPSFGGNTLPKHPIKNITLTFFNASATLIGTASGTVTYNASVKNFQGTISSNTLPTGQYLVFIHMEEYLHKQIPGIISVNQGQKITLPEVPLVTGDILNRNKIDVLDYNAILSCFGNNSTSSTCPAPITSQNQGADINDDGIVDGTDYNLFIRELSVQKGAGGESSPTPVTTPPAQTNVVVNINTSHVGLTVPTQFTGISTEDSSLCSMIKLDNESSKYSQLFKNLGHEVLRVGGNSGDKAIWSPNGAYCPSGNPVITDTLIYQWVTFMKKIGWNFTWSVNLGNYNPSAMAEEADYVYKIAGNTLSAIAIGNEPNDYILNGYRASGYGVTQYMSEWKAYQSALYKYNSSIPLMGDDQSQNPSWFGIFIGTEASQINLASFHLYPTTFNGTSTESPTIANLLSQSLMANTVTKIQTWKSYADSNNIPLGITETNSTSGGGKPGESNTFASALWGSDYLFTALELGIKRMNFHAIGGATYAAIDTNGNTKPLYYAFLFFHAATLNGGNVITTKVQSSPNTTAYSVLGKDGKLRVAVINKDLTNTAVVDIHTTQNYSQASVMYLTAPSVSSTSGVTFGGASVANDGTFSPTTSSLSMNNSTDTYVTLSPAEAALVTLQ